ncbi:gamma carbonic dehydratase [Trypanosoma rangeli]|uniref:Gamma carbonic dehydratase n=1 Tax=Trypanosoma rangeli TaxID=5698 RepID=A0A3R7L6Y8_TRYRA|nr:gamma carbonic dehydratase [Trypanosoma rangeli]RNF08852.1 gamma carbonic dehydratase [Trypanosoma rangeli]|eukprot:RNF08852.1 gamma carbonic dehydratase [Trypanosoma rangeli]
MDRASFLAQVRVGNGVYVGVGTTLECCNIGDGVYLGPGVSVALGAVVENGATVAAGSHVPKDTRIHAWELWPGNPAQKIAEVRQEQASEVAHIVHEQVKVAKEHVRAIHDHMHHTE